MEPSWGAANNARQCKVDPSRYDNPLTHDNYFQRLSAPPLPRTPIPPCPTPHDPLQPHNPVQPPNLPHPCLPSSSSLFILLTSCGICFQHGAFASDIVRQTLRCPAALGWQHQVCHPNEAILLQHYGTMHFARFWSKPIAKFARGVGGALQCTQLMFTQQEIQLRQ